jgi:poly-gamma-glutamate synthesis protein (capsule biosynthesis protein)
VTLVDDPGGAQVRLGLQPDLPLSRWVYTLVAPFPTLRDSASVEEIRGWWRGGAGPAARLYVRGQTRAAVESIWGPSSPQTVLETSSDDLVDRVWEEGAWAIIPFEELEPRWKVIALDGLSPLEHAFRPERYGLAVPYGASGNAAVLDTIGDNLGWPASNRDPDRLTVLLMTGVTAITRGVAWRIEAEGTEFPAARIGGWLREADVTHVSHEIAFAADCPPPDPYQPTLRFCGDPDHFGLLQSAGVDLVELTGNHILDWGRPAFLSTLGQYRSAGMTYFAGGVDLQDARQPALVEDHGNRIALLGCNMAGPVSALAKVDAPGGMPCDYEYLDAELGEFRGAGIVTIFTYQWQEAYRSTALPPQQAAFRRAIDAGATIVQGSQAHQPMGYEFYGGGFIHYGLGNLFFDQMWSIPTRQEMLDRHVIYDGRHISTEVLTAFLEDFAQPRPMRSEERQEFLEAIFAASGW